MRIVLLVIGFIIITVISIRDTLKSNKINTAMIFNMSLILITFVISVLLILDRSPIGPAYIIEMLVKLIIN